MPANETGPTANKRPAAPKAAWTTPRLTHLAASEAELGIGIAADGGLEQFS
jgi:hypothetical protein